MFRLVLLAFVLESCSSFGYGNPPLGHDEPGSPFRETLGVLREDTPAVQATESASAPGAGFDVRLVRVQPGIHLNTEQLCDVVAAGRLEPIESPTSGETTRYSESATHRMSIQCAAPTGQSWADLVFSATNSARATDIQSGTRIRIRILTADEGFFDYPIVELVAIVGPAPARAMESARSAAQSVSSPASGFDLRQLRTDPALVGTLQPCAVSHVGDIDILEARDLRRRTYPAGVQNRMTIRCRHGAGEEWADLVFMPAQARSALHIRRGDTFPVAVVSSSGGFFDYPVLQFAGE